MFDPLKTEVLFRCRQDQHEASLEDLHVEKLARKPVVISKIELPEFASKKVTSLDDVEKSAGLRKVEQG